MVTWTQLTWQCKRAGQKIKSSTIRVGTSRDNKTLGGFAFRLKNNNEMDLREQSERLQSEFIWFRAQTMSGSSGGLTRNQGQWQAPVAGYSETRDDGRLQWRDTAKPGTGAPVAG